MKILFMVHWIYQVRQAGSERYTDIVAEYFQQQGHEVTFFVDKEIQKISGLAELVTPYGAKVYVEGNVDLDDLVREHDVVWTHLNFTRKAINATRKHKKPVVVVHHNDSQLPLYEVKPHEVELNIYNTEWIKNKYEHVFKSKDHCVLIPPLRCQEYAVLDRSEQRMVTHVNCNEGKGTKFARAWAQETPEYDWLFVLGSYFKQLVPRGWAVPHKHLKIDMRELDMPDNCHYIPPTKNMLEDVLQKTRVAVVPSIIDSWGMFALEAMAAGIPVIAHPHPAFLESLGGGGMFVDRTKTWLNRDLITKLMEQDDFYLEKQQYSLARAAEVEALGRHQMDVMHEKLLRLEFS